MKVLLMVLQLFVMSPDHAQYNLIQEKFGFDETIIEDIRYVAEESDTSPFLLASIVDRESDGKREATRYCVEWRKKEKGQRPKCLKERSCYTGCKAKRHVWKNRLDVGLWQLRDAPTWSWVRWYRKNHNSDVGEFCAVERECSRAAMVQIVIYLKRRAKKGTRRCSKPRYMPEHQWVAYWNWCGSYNSHIKMFMQLTKLHEEKQ